MTENDTTGCHILGYFSKVRKLDGKCHQRFGWVATVQNAPEVAHCIMTKKLGEICPSRHFPSLIEGTYCTQWCSHWGGKRGQSVTPVSENLPRIWKKREKIRKNRGKKSGKIGKKEEKSGRKGKNWEVSFTLPLLTDRAGYATDCTARYFLFLWLGKPSLVACNASLRLRISHTCLRGYCSTAPPTPKLAFLCSISRLSTPSF